MKPDINLLSDNLKSLNQFVSIQFCAVLIIAVLISNMAWAAKSKPPSAAQQASSSNSSDERGYSGSVSGQINMDSTVHYVRDTATGGDSDTAIKFSIGGMFIPWLGLDGVGIYQIKSQNFLVGTDIKVVPVDWLYFKGGVGGYSDRRTRELKLSPLAAAGIKANINRDIYLVTETTYFQVSSQSNLSFGAGFGFSF